MFFGLLNTSFYLELNFILKIAKKACSFKKLGKLRKKLWQPCFRLLVATL